MTRKTAWFFAGVVIAGLCAGCGGGGGTSGGNGPIKQDLPEPSNASYSSLSAIWAFSDKDVWAVGSRVLHYDGAKWSEVPGPGQGIGLQALWGLAPDDLWATSGSQVFRYRGSAMGWVEVKHGIPNPPSFNAIWVSAPDDYVVGGGDVNWEVIRVKGATITRAYTYGATTGIWGASGDDIWAVSEEGGFWHWDGKAWTKNMVMGSGGDRPHAVWGFAAGDVWAAGEDETLRHWDGMAWTPTTTSNSYGAVWGAATTDVWAAGDDGVLSHYDGKSWTDSSTDTGIGAGVFFTSLSGSGPASVWASGYELSAAGNHGVVYRIK